jgi:hypothetical protein
MLQDIEGQEKQGIEVEVGIPGYGSHRRFSVRRDESLKSRANPDGLVLVETEPGQHQVDTEPGIEIHRAPVSVEMQNGRAVGGAIVNMARVYEPDGYREEVFIDHGSEDIFWYHRRQKELDSQSSATNEQRIENSSG